MITLIHIVIALSSLGYTAALFVRPTLAFTPAYGLIAGTLASGTAIMIINPLTITRVCVSGLIFLAVSIVVLKAAKYRQVRYFTTQ